LVGASVADLEEPMLPRAQTKHLVKPLEAARHGQSSLAHDVATKTQTREKLLSRREGTAVLRAKRMQMSQTLLNQDLLVRSLIQVEEVVVAAVDLPEEVAVVVVAQRW
jgi:hypothetical protein